MNNPSKPRFKQFLGYSSLINVLLSASCLLIFINNIIFREFNERINSVSAWLLIIISLYFVYKCRHNILLFVVSIFMFYSNYSIAVGIYLYPNRPVVLYHQITDVSIYGIGITLVLTFMWILVMLMPRNINRLNIAQGTTNRFIVICLCSALMLIFIYGYNQTASLIRGASSPIYEYSVILFILGFYYSGDNSYLQTLMKVFVILFAFQSFFHGTRIEGLIFLLALLCYYYGGKLTYKQLIPYAVVVTFLMVFIGIFRANASWSIDSISYVLSVMRDNLFVFDTATWAYFPSLGMIEVRNLIPQSESIRLFGNFVLSIIFGSSVPDSNVVQYVKQYYYHSNGGWLQMFFYFWFGWSGLFIIAGLIVFYLRVIINQPSKGYRYLLAIYIVSTVPRWYLYTPLHLLRGVLLFSIAFLGLFLINRIEIHRRKPLRLRKSRE